MIERGYRLTEENIGLSLHIVSEKSTAEHIVLQAKFHDGDTSKREIDADFLGINASSVELPTSKEFHALLISTTSLIVSSRVKQIFDTLILPSHDYIKVSFIQNGQCSFSASTYYLLVFHDDFSTKMEWKKSKFVITDKRDQSVVREVTGLSRGQVMRLKKEYPIADYSLDTILLNYTDICHIYPATLRSVLISSYVHTLLVENGCTKGAYISNQETFDRAFAAPGQANNI